MGIGLLGPIVAVAGYPVETIVNYLPNDFKTIVLGLCRKADALFEICDCRTRDDWIYLTLQAGRHALAPGAPDHSTGN
jgi:hypothetical protein